jgi:hypothetical protein
MSTGKRGESDEAGDSGQNGAAVELRYNFVAADLG